MHRGYFKVWRQLEDSDLWATDPLTIKIWLWILMHACHKEQRLPNLTLQPGELITTYAAIMEAMVVPGHGFRKRVAPSIQTVRTSMQALCALYVISKQQAPQQGGLHIKVLQWDKFQGTNAEPSTGYATDISTDFQQTSNTIQECKAVKALDQRLFLTDTSTPVSPKVEGGFSAGDGIAHAVAVAKANSLTPPSAQWKGRLGKTTKERLQAGATPANLMLAIERMVVESKSPAMLEALLRDVEKGKNGNGTGKRFGDGRSVDGEF